MEVVREGGKAKSERRKRDYPSTHIPVSVFRIRFRTKVRWMRNEVGAVGKVKWRTFLRMIWRKERRKKGKDRIRTFSFSSTYSIAIYLEQGPPGLEKVKKKNK